MEKPAVVLGHRRSFLACQSAPNGKRDVLPSHQAAALPCVLAAMLIRGRCGAVKQSILVDEKYILHRSIFVNRNSQKNQSKALFMGEKLFKL
jgi:hypothetical protein